MTVFFFGGIIIGLIWEILAYDEILPTSRSWVTAKKLWWIGVVGLPVMMSIMNGQFPNLFFGLGLIILLFRFFGYIKHAAVATNILNILTAILFTASILFGVYSLGKYIHRTLQPDYEWPDAPPVGTKEREGYDRNIKALVDEQLKDSEEVRKTYIEEYKRYNNGQEPE